MKLTTQQLKRIIKEELSTVLDEALPAKEEWQDIWNDCVQSGKSEDDCTDLAAQVYGRGWDDETIKKHLDHEYGDKQPEKLRPKKSETDEINAWIAQSAEDAYQERNAAAIEAEKWEKLYASFDWSQIYHMPNHWIGDRYRQIFGKWPDSVNHTRRIKRKIGKWMEVHEVHKS